MRRTKSSRKVTQMRVEEFKMERPGLLSEGDEVEITERSTIAFYYYMILPATAMSGNYSLGQRIKSRKGIVKDIRKNEKGYFVDVEFEN